LCELDDCSINAAVTHEYVVFRSELDFQAHKKQKHAKSKSEAKSLGKLNIEFTINDPKREKLRRNYRGVGRSSYERGNGGALAAAAANNLDSTDEEWYDRPNKENQSKIQTIDFDPNAIRISQEEYEKEEQRRRIERLKAQYENANSSATDNTKVSSIASSSLAATEASDAKNFSELTASNMTASEKSTNDTQQTHWRDIIGGAGSAPKLNAEAEFPSLMVDNASGPLSLESIGAFIQHSSKNNPWKKNKLNANIETKNNASKSSIENLPKNSTDSKKNEKKAHEKNNSTNKSSQLIENKNMLQDSPKKNTQMVEPSATKQKSNETIKEKTKQDSKILTEKQVNESNNITKKHFSQLVNDNSSFLSAISDTTTPKPFQPLPPPGFNKPNLNVFNLNDMPPPPGFKIKSNDPTKLVSNATSLTDFEHTKFNNKNNNNNNNNNNNQKNILDEDFPSLSSNNQFTSNTNSSIPPQKSNDLMNLIEEFPPLSLGSNSNTETRYSTLPTPAIFSNPSSHLSLTNKKKHRLQK
jgi:hypothetical protein